MNTSSSILMPPSNTPLIGTSPFGTAQFGETRFGEERLGNTGTDRRTRDFASVMATADRGLAGQAADTPEGKARDAAEQMVSMTLVEPLLKMARESNTAPPPFGPGQGEKAFAGLLDAGFAREIVRSAQFPLVDRLARNMLNRGQSAVQPAAEPT